MYNDAKQKYAALGVDTEKVIEKIKYILYLNEEEYENGETDENGQIIKDDLVPGLYQIVFTNEEKQ